MAITLYSNGTLFGVVEPLPLAGFPAGRKRIKIRADDFVQVFVKTEIGVRWFYIQEINGVWVPFAERGINAFDTTS